MTKKLSMLIIFLFIFLNSSFSLAQCVLKMGYKEASKPPLINAKPDNSGVYFDLYSLAAKKIGCELAVIRLPKKRLHNLLANGSIDFYPGSSFSEQRSKYLHYIANGLSTGQYGVTLSKLPQITSFKQIKTLGLTWVMELGSSKLSIANTLKIKALSVASIDFKSASKFLMSHRAQFVILDKVLIDNYLVSQNITTLESKGLQIHRLCCGGIRPMYLGFSKLSAHLKLQINQDYDSQKPLSFLNVPRTLAKGNLAYQLEKALLQMHESGESIAIYRRYFF